MRDFVAAAMAEIRDREVKTLNHGVDHQHFVHHPIHEYSLFAYSLLTYLWSDFIHDYPETRLAETMANHQYVSKEALK